MTVLMTKKIIRGALLFAGIAVFGFFFAGFFGNKTDVSQVKADRSSAMQVTKSVVQEQSTPVLSPDFFTEYRLERDKIRSERSDLLQQIIKDARSEEVRRQAQDNILKLIQEKQRESEIENLIKARGFADAIVFIKESSVSAVVKTTSLSREEVQQVADVINRSSGVRMEDITISAKP